MPDEAEVKALADKLEEVEVTYRSLEGHRRIRLGRILVGERAETLARVALEFCEERRQEYIDRLNNRAIGQSYREED